MNKNGSTIPIVIGVTAHRAIRKDDEPALYQSVKAELEKLQKQYPGSPFLMLSSLAEGGDLLCAAVGEELGIPLLAALPMPVEEFEKDFTPPAKERLAAHCLRAEEVFVVPGTEPLPEGGPTRDYLYRQAGIYVAAHCHLLLALWDGGPGTAAACGTAEAVDFALTGNYFPSVGVPLRSESNTGVLHVLAPRSGSDTSGAGEVRFLGNREAVEGILSKTDEFNRGAQETPQPAKSRLPKGAVDEPKLQQMEKISLTAGKLSSVNAEKFRRALALLAAASTVLTFAFLMYDEVQAIWMILVCGVMLLCAWVCSRYAAKSDCHRKYIEYRALAECLRVQLYLRYAGSEIEAAQLLSWTQQDETAWIMTALCALTAGKSPGSKNDIRDCWVEDQRRYHVEAGKRSLRDKRVSENTVQTALIISIGLYLTAVFFELLCGGILLAPVIHLPDVEACRMAIKLLLGTLSAVTLFVGNYYGRLSLSRVHSDHQKMARFYSKIEAHLDRSGQTEEVLTVLAREELAENGNWCSYQRDNQPDISL